MTRNDETDVTHAAKMMIILVGGVTTRSTDRDPWFSLLCCRSVLASFMRLTVR